jgi:acetyl esterase/lipase
LRAVSLSVRFNLDTFSRHTKKEIHMTIRKGLLLALPAALLMFACSSTPKEGALAGAGGPPPMGNSPGGAPPTGAPPTGGAMPGGNSMPGNGPGPGGGSTSGSGSPPTSGTAQRADTSWIRTKHLNIAYAAKSSTEKLDLYLPNEGSGPFPLIIEFHSGDFMTGDKSGDIGPMLEGLKRGYAVASVAYRLSGEAAFPAAVNDAKAAIKFLRANAQKYRLNPAKFATWGSSAGGYLSAMAATSGDEASLVDPSLGNAGVSDAVQAAVDWFGPVYFSTMDQQFAALGTSGITGPTNAATSAESRYLGKTIGTLEAQPLVEQASPLTYVSAKTAPMYIQHSTMDRNVPITQSKILAEEIASAIGPGNVIFESIEGSSHGGGQFDAAVNAVKVLDFLDRYLK